MPHREREALAARFPVHVTMRMAEGLPSLREGRAYRALREALEQGDERFGFRLVRNRVQPARIDLIAKARDRRALARGMQGLTVRCARALNRTWGRKGRVFGDRYEARILRTPEEMRKAMGSARSETATGVERRS